MSTSKPVIGITGDFRPERYDGAALSWFNTGYYDSVIAAGGLPILLPPFEDEKDLEAIMEKLDGIVLCGCNLDLDPTRIKMHPHPAVKVMPKRREDFDRRLTEMAIARRLPILAIGSGMQLVNVLCGGTLFQHIPEDLPKALHHRDPVEKNLRHVLEVVPGTRVDAIYGPGEVRVNSNHHMSVKQLANRFRVSATCPDGVVEAYESIEDDWFCLGVQWHPESTNASALDLQIFEAFVDASMKVAEQELETRDIIPMSTAVHRAA
ncbi:MAG: gamma-glutamyl-gamma-aminobutyrate hydrolase family protein [Planctomycetaceae bacterium]|nr:gamma-glutamyl-gamma-aminobutyrate hydrolase family protein [Planctomycetaceae bacterium]